MPMTALSGQLVSGLPARNLPFPPTVRLRAPEKPQVPIAPAGEGVLRWVWESRYGPILIEAMGDEVFVNGQRVEPHAP